MYLLDTGIIAALRKAKWEAELSPLAQWARRIAPANLFISALSLLELENGVAYLMKRDPEAAAPLRDWLDTQIVRAFDGRILSLDAAIVRRRAGLSYEDSRDGLMAATALEHGLTLVTRRPTAYRAGRVRLLNPFDTEIQGPTDSPADWTEGANTAPNWLRNLFLRF